MTEQSNDKPRSIPRGFRALYDKTTPGRPNLPAAIKRTRIIAILAIACWPAVVVAWGPFGLSAAMWAWAVLVLLSVIMFVVDRRGSFMRAAMAWSKIRPQLGLPWLIEAIELPRRQRLQRPGRIIGGILTVAIFYQLYATAQHHATWMVLIPWLGVVAGQFVLNQVLNHRMFRVFGERIGEVTSDVEAPQDDWRSKRRF